MTCRSARARTVRFGDCGGELLRLVCSTLTVARNEAVDTRVSSCKRPIGTTNGNGGHADAHDNDNAMPKGKAKFANSLHGHIQPHSGFLKSAVLGCQASPQDKCL